MMVYLLILYVVALIALIVATITDFKTREVPDWLSYGLIFVGVGLNLMFSFVYWDYWFLVDSLVGLVIFLIFALIMFYTGQWGGGDSKVLMGLGALIGFDVRFSGFPFLVTFFINILLVGAVYGLVWSFMLVFKNWRSFLREFRKGLRKMAKVRNYLIVSVCLMLVLAYFLRGNIFGFILFVISLFSVTTFCLWVFVKAVEKVCMIKSVTPDKLTEGDWIVKNIKYKGKYICGPKDLGIEKKQIRKLLRLYKQNKIKKVLIKEGIPFVPSFLIAFIITLFFGNLLFLLV